MEIENLITHIGQASDLLYQNQEQLALEEVKSILVQLQKIISGIANLASEQIAKNLIDALHELIEGYRSLDMLNMADCLKGKILPILEMCRTS